MLPFNPAAAVRGPRHSVKRGKTPMLTAAETRVLLDSLQHLDPAGRASQALHDARDRALIGLMVYTFARVGAARPCGSMITSPKGGGCGSACTRKAARNTSCPAITPSNTTWTRTSSWRSSRRHPPPPLFQTVRRATLTGRSLGQPDVWRMLRRRATAAGIRTKIGAHTFRATGITTYLQNGGELELAQQMANHESPRTTSLYDRRHDQVSLDEVERILI